MNDEIKAFLINIKGNEEYKAIYNYITNLQDENERLKEWKKDLLSENIELENIRKEAVEKVKDIIEGNNSALSNPEYAIVSKHKLLKLNNIDCKELLNILQGGKDE